MESMRDFFLCYFRAELHLPVPTLHSSCFFFFSQNITIFWKGENPTISPVLYFIFYFLHLCWLFVSVKNCALFHNKIFLLLLQPYTNVVM